MKEAAFLIKNSFSLFYQGKLIIPANTFFYDLIEEKVGETGICQNFQFLVVLQLLLFNKINYIDVFSHFSIQ